ncbi:MAG: phosphatase PAP2 family protein [Dysgonamonadaceae bacterium]
MKEAVENLLPYEREIFFALNGSNSVFLDNLFWTLTGRIIWIPVILFLLFMFFYKVPKKEGVLVTICFILILVFCDQVASSVFKPFFERLRPTHHPDFEKYVDIVNGYKGGVYGFISSHAANAFGIAVFLSLLFRNKWIVISSFLWATINSYTRIYLGVHFVSDVIGGIIVGSVVALLLYLLYVRIRVKCYHVEKQCKYVSVYSFKSGKSIGLFILLYMASVIIFSPFLATLVH